MRHTLILISWALLICCVVAGSVSPAGSPVVSTVGRLQVNDKLLHFAAYLMLASLPVLGFRGRRTGMTAGLSMLILGVLLEAVQHFSPGRAFELADMAADGAGVSCGLLLAFPVRAPKTGSERRP